MGGRIQSNAALVVSRNDWLTMDSNLHARDLDALKKERIFLRIGLLGLVALAIFQEAHIWRIAENVKVVQETPWGDRTKWIRGSKVSEAKLSEMGAWIAHLQLDVSERTIQFNTDTLLNWTDGSYSEAVRAKAKATERRLKQYAASTAFEVLESTPDPDHMRVAMRGPLTTWINGVPNTPETKAYIAEFKFDSGRLTLKDWYEAGDTDDPLGLKQLPGKQGPTKAVDVAASAAMSSSQPGAK